MKETLQRIVRSKWFLASAGVLVGALIILGIRFVTYQPEEVVHYHANFAMYLNGQRELFKNPVYYTDLTESCAVEEQMSPHERAHMHDGVNDVVHVEDHAVTWGQFFQNLGWVVDNNIIRTPTQLLTPTDQNKITFMLNGEETSNLVSRIIQDRDQLLVDFGATSTQDLQKEFKTVPSTAVKYDTSQDPKSCSGHEPTTMRTRMMHLF
ncbi:MAG: hypothetical protein WC498_00725 [Candidatus Saccharimonadales bacterium]